MNRTEFIGTELYYSQEFVDDKNKEIERLYKGLKLLQKQNREKQKIIYDVLEIVEKYSRDDFFEKYFGQFILDILRGVDKDGEN